MDGGSGAPGGGSTSPPPPPSGAASALAFPLSKAAGARRLNQGSGQPALVNGDAAWFVMLNSREDTTRYLDDRAQRRFNALVAYLIVKKQASQPANFYGQRPFAGAPFATPNDAYFGHVDYVVSQAASRGMAAILVPAWCGPGGEDWYVLMETAGAATLKEYGRYLGNRYRNQNNIIWMHGGDNNPGDRTLVTAIVDGIKEVDPSKLHTVHSTRSANALQDWAGGSGWIDVGTSYTGADDVVARCQEQYDDPLGLPFLQIEGFYENERGATARDLRLQLYQSMLSGACGHAFGNHPVYEFVQGWQNALASTGAQHQTIGWQLFSSVRWDLLLPDFSHQFLTGGIGAGKETAVAAVASDRSFAIAYTPAARTLTLNLGGLAGPRVSARWYSPVTGAFVSAAASNPAASGSANFSTPSTNEDWALLLESAS